MKIHKCLFIALIALVSCNKNSIPEFGRNLYDHKPMLMDTANSLQYLWDHKEVIESVQIDNMESLKNWELSYGDRENIGSISLSDEKVFEGNSSIKFTCRTRPDSITPYGERYWGRQNLTRRFDHRNFEGFNRISIRIYPHFKGFRKVYLTLIFHNEGNVPDKYGKEGWHTVMLKNNQWNKLVMEIPHLPHDSVTGITISYGLQGNEPDASDTIVYYADNLMLERVEPDYYEGWNTDRKISFSHSGYNSGDRKIAFTSLKGGNQFSIVNARTGKVVFTGTAEKYNNRIGEFSVFDFTKLTVPGFYRIVFDKYESENFPVEKDVWLPVLEKLTNYFYVQRCGYEQPGIHLQCHNDWYTVNGKDTIIMSGGWHDAGDVSQSYWQTASATAAFFKLGRQYSKKNKPLSDRMIEEGKWGLKWLHKNRFDSMKVVSWTTIDRYTDGILGNNDDAYSALGRKSSLGDNCHAIIAEVEAALTLKSQDHELSGLCTDNAMRYWRYIMTMPQQWNTESLSLAVLAGAKLYELTKNAEVRDQAVVLADSLQECQQTQPVRWTIPLSGFFYTDKNSDRLFGYNHSCIAASPVLGLVELCRLLPDHPKNAQWRNSVGLYANYLKTTAALTAPYYMIPANVYKLNGSSDDAQILQGIKMDDSHYLRMFPVWQAFRGNNSVILSPAVGLASANRLLNDPAIRNIALSQLEWQVGKNPFCQSLMYGEGYRFTPQYAVFTDDIVGGLPVGILTKDNSDIPYWKTSVLHNYKEIWGQPAFRMMELLSYLYND